MKVALLTQFENDWASPIVLRCEAFDWVTLDPGALGLSDSPNPFRLPVDSTADLVLLERTWYDWLQREHSERAEAVLRRLEQIGLVGLDGSDDFQLGFPPDVAERMRLVLKPQGVYRDRDLFNYRLGAWHGDGESWTEKVRPRRMRYTDAQLAKVRLSVPCLLLDVPAFKRAARRHYGIRGPARLGRNVAEVATWELIPRLPVRRTRDVHCLVKLTHMQRVDALRELQGLGGTQGIASIPRQVAGADGRDVQAEAAPFLRPGLGRFAFILDLVRHRVAVAPTGYGELGQRHGLALQAGAALVCQSLAHVETMFPFRPGENVVYCSPDLSDLRQVVEELLADDERRESVARRGQLDYREWAARWREHLEAGVEAPLREALGA